MPLQHDSTPHDLYQHENGSLYRVVGYQPNPTVILEQITEHDGSPVPKERLIQVTHAIGCLNAEPFTLIGKFPIK